MWVSAAVKLRSAVYEYANVCVPECTWVRWWWWWWWWRVPYYHRAMNNRGCTCYVWRFVRSAVPCARVCLRVKYAEDGNRRWRNHPIPFGLPMMNAIELYTLRTPVSSRLDTYNYELFHCVRLQSGGRDDSAQCRPLIFHTYNPMGTVLNSTRYHYYSNDACVSRIRATIRLHIAKYWRGKKASIYILYVHNVHQTCTVFSWGARHRCRRRRGAAVCLTLTKTYRASSRSRVLAPAPPVSGHRIQRECLRTSQSVLAMLVCDVCDVMCVVSVCVCVCHAAGLTAQNKY